LQALRPSRAKDEIDGSDHAQRCPKKIQLQRLTHIKDGKGCENRQRDDLLKNLQLAQTVLGIAKPIRRDLKKILEKRQSPDIKMFEMVSRKIVRTRIDLKGT
jgi:hypothetical protein